MKELSEREEIIKTVETTKKRSLNNTLEEKGIAILPVQKYLFVFDFKFLLCYVNFAIYKKVI